MTRVAALLIAILALPLLATPAGATPFFFSTGDADGKIATATRPESAGKFEIESADDFVLTGPTSISKATFTGLLTGGATTANIGEVRVEIYRVFPADSNVARTSGPPLFSTPEVPTRVNSPSDVEFVDRDNAPSPGNLTFTTKVLNTVFTAANSVQPGGIHPIPDQTTGGNGPITGQEVEFDVTFTRPFHFRPTTISLSRKSRSPLLATSFGCRRRGRSCRPARPSPRASQTCSHGPAMIFRLITSPRIGSESAPISSAPALPLPRHSMLYSH
jgi:hypothetical protein